MWTIINQWRHDTRLCPFLILLIFKMHWSKCLAAGLQNQKVLAKPLSWMILLVRYSLFLQKSLAQRVLITFLKPSTVRESSLSSARVSPKNASRPSRSCCHSLPLSVFKKSLKPLKYRFMVAFWLPVSSHIDSKPRLMLRPFYIKCGRNITLSACITCPQHHPRSSLENTVGFRQRKKPNVTFRHEVWLLLDQALKYFLLSMVYYRRKAKWRLNQTKKAKYQDENQSC